MLTNATLPAALLECASLMSAAEKALPTPADNIQISYDIEASLATITAALPFVSSGSGGRIEMSPVNYAPIADFNAGSVTALADGATVTNPAAALARIAEAANRQEEQRRNAGGTIPTGVGIGLTTDFDASILSVNAVLPISQELVSGNPRITVSNYLA
jgi:hypothetical protein